MSRYFQRADRQSDEGGTGAGCHFSVQVALGAPGRAQSPQSTGRHLVLVANGGASGLNRSRIGCFKPRARRWECGGARVETHLTESTAELAAAWPAFQDRRVVLLGGDGTLHTAANLPSGPLELALLPAGRANNVARALGIPLDLAAAAELATSGGARPVDLISATSGTRSYLAVEGVSVGFHALARASYRAENSALRRRRDPVGGLGPHAAFNGLDALRLERPRGRDADCGPALRCQPRPLRVRASGRSCAPARTTVSSTWSHFPGKGGRYLILTVARLRRGSACPPPWHAHLDGRAGEDRDGGELARDRGHDESRNRARDARGRPRSTAGGGAMSVAAEDLSSRLPPRREFVPLPYLSRLRCGCTRSRALAVP